ncbi:hypothetical protein ANTPLA_LOCUS10245 [Anthophora plagiata]
MLEDENGRAWRSLANNKEQGWVRKDKDPPREFGVGNRKKIPRWISTRKIGSGKRNETKLVPRTVLGENVASRKITGRCKVLIPVNYGRMCDSSIEEQNRDGTSRDVMKKTGTRTEGLRVDLFRLLLAPF